VVELPVRFTLVAAQVNNRSLPANTFGSVVFVETETVDEFVQPFAGLVTVSVYVPFAFAVAEDVFAPETIPGPVQA
jgi:hypothetical protein